MGSGLVLQEIWSNEKRRNWRFWINGIYPEPEIFQRNDSTRHAGVGWMKLRSGVWGRGQEEGVVLWEIPESLMGIKKDNSQNSILVQSLINRLL